GRVPLDVHLAGVGRHPADVDAGVRLGSVVVLRIEIREPHRLDTPASGGLGADPRGPVLLHACLGPAKRTVPLGHVAWLNRARTRIRTFCGRGRGRGRGLRRRRSLRFGRAALPGAEPHDLLIGELTRCAEVREVRVLRQPGDAYRWFEQGGWLLAEFDLGDLGRLRPDRLSRAVDPRPFGAQDEPALDVEPEVDPATGDVVRAAPRNGFETDITPARRRSPATDLARPP